MNETAIVTRILDYLTLRGYFVYRNNTGATKYKDERGRVRFVRYGYVGSSDILGMTRDGKYLAIEVKTPERANNVSPAQAKFINIVNNGGGVAFVATSIEEVADKLNEKYE